MTMSELHLVEVRLMGEEPLVRQVLERMGWVLDVSWDGGLPAKRRGEGVRAYAQVRVPDLADLERRMPDA